MSSLQYFLGHDYSMLHTIHSSALVSEAIARMNESRIDALLVADEGRVLGILTERDVLVRVVEAKHDPDAILVSRVMSRDLVTIEPSATLEDAMNVMTTRGHRHLPVAANGNVVAVVSKNDVTRWIAQDREARISDLISFITRG